MELLLALILSALATSPGPESIVVTPSGVELRLLADNTMIPGTVGSFFFIETTLPEACGEKVLFTGFDERARLGLYSASTSGVEIIADTTTPVPGSTATFQDARGPRCVGGRAFFLGDGDMNPRTASRSVYTWYDGQASLVLAAGAPVAGTVIESVNELDVNEIGIATVSRLVSSVSQGVVAQRFGGEPFLIADRATVLPGQTQPADAYSRPVAADHDIVFSGRTFVIEGIYRWSEAGGISTIVDTSMPVAVLGGQPFLRFNQIIGLDDGIVFGAEYAGGSGIFISRNGVIEHLVAPGDVTVDAESLIAARFPRGEAGLISFSGTVDVGIAEMLFARNRDGSIKRLLSFGETLGGRMVGVRLVSDADRESVALRVDHGPDSQAIYRASFPAPATTEIPVLSDYGFALLVVGLAVAGMWLLRRSAPGV